MTTKNDFFSKDVRKVAVVGHVHPDGDCAGSVTAAYLYLTENCPELEVVPFLEPLPDNLRFLTENIPVREDDGDGEIFDQCICLDCASQERIGAGKKAFENAVRTICMDHHETNTGFADESYIIPDCSSTCEVLCGRLHMDRISEETAVRLYTGMVHDSGLFAYDCTAGSTMRYAAELIEKGIDFSEIVRKSFTEESYSVMKFTSEVISKSVLDPEIHFLSAQADQALLLKYGLDTRDIGSVVAQLNKVREADVVLFSYQYEDGSWKASLRSKNDINVADIAFRLGGGGHRKAAGFSTAETPEKICEKISDYIRECVK